MHACNHHTTIVLIFLTINIFLSENILCNLHSRANSENYTLFGDMPVKDDLDKYLGSLERVIDFSLRNEHHVDLNFEFGLFLINVHLKPIIKNKRSSLSLHNYHRLAKLLHDNDKVIRYFHYMVNNMPAHIRMLNEEVSKIPSLYANETFWIQRLPALTMDLVKKTKRRTRSQLRSIYSKPNTYQQNVLNFDKGIPNPKLSDKCMSFLADNMPYDGLRVTKCQLPEICRKMLKKTTDMGYFICHKLLHFLAAHMGRGCVVLSEQQDRATIREMCTMIADEARYIAMNYYSIKDLLLEEVALCSLSGQAHFLQRSWISEVLRFQTKLGCFGNEITSLRYPKSEIDVKWIFAKGDSDIMGGYCNTHLTAVAGATLAAAVRYILENYY